MQVMLPEIDVYRVSSKRGLKELEPFTLNLTERTLGTAYLYFSYNKALYV